MRRTVWGREAWLKDGIECEHQKVRSNNEAAGDTGSQIVLGSVRQVRGTKGGAAGYKENALGLSCRNARPGLVALFRYNSGCDVPK